MEVSPLFYEIRNSQEKIIVLQGGQWAGKTYEALDNILLWSIEMPGLISTIVAEDVPNLKRGVIRDTFRIINDNSEIRQHIINYNKTDRLLTFNNGSIIEYTSYEDEQDAKGGKRNILFINEADAEQWEVYWQLASRTDLAPFSKVIIDYNPTASFWAHDKLIGKPNVKYIITDHRHNTFLTQEQHDQIEGIEDPELWRVYARGLTGQMKASIYPMWKNIRIDDFPEEYDELIWAIDYGYGDSKTAGKTAIIKIGFKKPNRLYLREICYHPGGMDEFMIKDVLEANGWENGQEYYSEHDPDMISAQRRLGMHIRMAIKGPRSEWHGIMTIKRFSVYYSAEDENLNYEHGHYKWVTVGELVTNQVEDTNKFHLMAALRYGVYTHFFSR